MRENIINGNIRIVQNEKNILNSFLLNIKRKSFLFNIFFPLR